MTLGETWETFALSEFYADDDNELYLLEPHIRILIPNPLNRVQSHVFNRMSAANSDAS